MSLFARATMPRHYHRSRQSRKVDHGQNGFSEFRTRCAIADADEKLALPDDGILSRTCVRGPRLTRVYAVDLGLQGNDPRKSDIITRPIQASPSYAVTEYADVI